MQVKIGKQCHVNRMDRTATCTFTRQHLDYWRRQPVPVFAALVPTEWPIRTEPDIYIVDLTTTLLFESQWRHQTQSTLQSHYYWPAGDFECVQSFLAEHIPATTARLQVSTGVIKNEPTIAPQYVRKAPYVPVTRFRAAIEDQLRLTAALSIIFTIESGTMKDDDMGFLLRMAGVVAQFVEGKYDEHWENHKALGYACHANGDFVKALEMYIEAKKSIERDANVANEPDWQPIVRELEKLEEQARQHQPLDLRVL
jgi:hypothetical protein